MVQLSHPYVTIGKAIALAFVGKVMSLLFKMSRFVVAFLPKIKYLLISWPQSLFPVILEPEKIKCHYFHLFSIYLPISDETRCCDLSFLNV